MQAAVFAGIAVSVVGKSSVLPGMRILGHSDSFPPLPKVDLVLYRSARRSSPAVEAMADFIVRHFASSTLAPPSRYLRTQAGSGSHV
jgi:DNA-binding transcriptional LysR family regulator